MPLPNGSGRPAPLPATGLTLTRAREIVVAELPWNPQTALQAEGRADRIGLGHKLAVRYCVAPGSVGETLWAMLDRKALTAGAVLDGDAERHRLDLSGRPAEGPVTSVLRPLVEDELRAMTAEAEVRPNGRWKPTVQCGRTKPLAARATSAPEAGWAVVQSFRRRSLHLPSAALSSPLAASPAPTPSRSPPGRRTR